MFLMLIFDELKTGIMLWIHLSSQSSTISCHCRSAFFAISWMVGITKALNFILMYHFHYDANTTIYLITVFLLFQVLISQAHLHRANDFPPWSLMDNLQDLQVDIPHIDCRPMPIMKISAWRITMYSTSIFMWLSLWIAAAGLLIAGYHRRRYKMSRNQIMAFILHQILAGAAK